MLGTGRAVRYIELAAHFSACSGAGVVIKRSDGFEIRNRPANIILGIEFGLGLEVTIQRQRVNSFLDASSRRSRQNYDDGHSEARL
jgi:hypothetical protein